MATKSKSFWRVVIFEGVIKFGLIIYPLVVLGIFFFLDVFTYAKCLSIRAIKSDCQLFDWTLLVISELPKYILFLIAAGIVSGINLWKYYSEKKI